MSDRRLVEAVRKITQLRYCMRGACLVFVATRRSASGLGARNPPGAPGKEEGVIRRISWLPLALILSIVALTALGCGGGGKSGTTQSASKTSGSAAVHAAFALAFLAEPTAQVPVNQGTMARTVSILRQRIAAVVPGGQATIAVIGVGGKIFVHAASRSRISQQRLISLVGTTARLEFYDWEANALTPKGRTVASLLLIRDPTAVKISQGGGPAPGSAGAGSMPLYQAVELAAKQPYSASQNNARVGPEYFAFGAPGSTACATAARDQHTLLFVGQHCYLAGPAENLQDLHASLPPHVSLSEGQVLTVQRGTVVLQASPPGIAPAPAWSDPNAQFYVLRDHVALFGTEATNPQPSTDQTGHPFVTFGLAPKGQSAYQNLTAQIAHRGALDSTGQTSLNQHFAVALDTQLVTVPMIESTAYPNGIPGNSGGAIFGPFTVQSARDLATQLRLGALPINLKLIAVVPQH
jgi:SecD/SecF fusion protein